jgi:hypothetical protein
MSIRDVKYYEYWDETGKYKTPYVTEPFSMYVIVADTMNKDIPICKSTKVLNDDLENVNDALSRKQFEKACLRRINRLYVTKGSLTKHTIVEKAEWKHILNSIHQAWYQLKRDPSRFDWVTVRKYRCKLKKGETPEEVYVEVMNAAANRDIAINVKNSQRELHFKENHGIKPLYLNDYKKHVKALQMKQIESKEDEE